MLAIKDGDMKMSYHKMRSAMRKYANGRKVLSGYKVCAYNEENLNLMSAIWGSLKYDIGHITIPQKDDHNRCKDNQFGPLCIFGKLEYAKRFYNRISELQMATLFACLYIRSDEVSVWSVIPGLGWYEEYMLEQLSQGTVLADAVMLTMPIDELEHIRAKK